MLKTTTPNQLTNKSFPTSISTSETILGQYQIISQKKGTNSNIYCALEPNTNKMVAIKVVNPEHCQNGNNGTKSWKKIEMIEREFNVGIGLDHKNLCHYFSAVVDEKRNTHYLIREWVEGEPLLELVKQRKITDSMLKQIIIEIIDALEYVHSRGIIHRDIKPSNIIVKIENNEICSVKLIDFGAVNKAKTDSDGEITSHIGTVGYLAPEALSFPSVQSDIFSLGATILYAKTAQDASAKFDPNINFKELLKETGAFSQIIKKCLQTEAKNRYESVLEIRSDLESTKLVQWKSKFNRYILSFLPISLLTSNQIEMLISTGEYRFIDPEKFVKRCVLIFDKKTLMNWWLDDLLIGQHQEILEKIIINWVGFDELKQIYEQRKVNDRFIELMFQKRTKFEHTAYMYYENQIKPEIFEAELVSVAHFLPQSMIKSIYEKRISEKAQFEVSKTITLPNLAKDLLYGGYVTSTEAENQLVGVILNRHNEYVRNSSNIELIRKVKSEAAQIALAKRIYNPETAFELIKEEYSSEVEYILIQKVNESKLMEAFNFAKTDKAKEYAISRFNRTDIKFILDLHLKIETNEPTTNSAILNSQSLQKSFEKLLEQCKKYTIPITPNEAIELITRFSLKGKSIVLAISLAVWNDSERVKELIDQGFIDRDSLISLTLGDGVWNKLSLPKIK